VGMELPASQQISPGSRVTDGGINLSRHQLASNEDFGFGGLRRGAQVGDFVPA
jgi:hypothetical protein